MKVVERPLSLNYAPTPPSDRAQVVRSADGFVMTLPPRLSCDFAMISGVAIATASVLIAAALWPFGDVWPLSAAGAIPRLIKAGVGIYVIYSVIVQFIAGRRDWTVITLRNGQLTVTTPHLVRSSSRRYVLGDYKDARMDCTDAIGCLALVSHDGAEKVILQNTIYRPRDLRFATRVLRDTIKQVDPKYVREQAELDVALNKLRDALPERSPSDSPS
jgi:hypothetical protein